MFKENKTNKGFQCKMFLCLMKSEINLTVKDKKNTIRN